ncbi:MAG: hypothetical protein R3322_07270 [Kiloniellales bacterium]|nr:hypothetical protein [Kiloniellales bacterium]
MTDAKAEPEIAAGDLMGPALADVVVDPAVLAPVAVLEPLAILEPLAAGPAPSPAVPSDDAPRDDMPLADASWADAPGDDALVLNLADLLPDVDGAVVMLTDDIVPVSLVTDEPLSGQGVVGAPASAGGLDVQGLYYYSFANGLTLYSDTDIVIVNESLGA